MLNLQINNSYGNHEIRIKINVQFSYDFLKDNNLNDYYELY